MSEPKATKAEAEQAIRDGVRELFEEMLGMLSADDADRAAGRERMEAGMERTMRAFGKDVDWDGLTTEMDAEQIKAATKLVLRDEAIKMIAPMRAFMRIDPDTSIHDLTDAEAADLRALCEAIMRGPTPMDHPLFVAWSKASGLDNRQSLLAFTTAFLPRALHALLRRADNRVLDEAQAALYAADRAKAAAQKRYDEATSEWRKALAAASGGHA